MKRKLGAFFCALLLCLGLVAPASATDDVMFIALNDTFPIALSADTMPFWSDGLLYVPSTTFDFRVTGISMGFYSVYSAYNQNIVLYTMEEMLYFDLSNNTCYNYHTKESYAVSAIVQNGVPFVPVSTVCDFFGLTYNRYTTPYGELLRIKDSNVVLSDAVFIDAGSDMMSNRLKAYTQSLTTTDTTTPDTTVPDTTIPEDTTTPVVTQVSYYLGVICEEDGDTRSVLSALDEGGGQALFLLTPQQMEDGDLIREIVGSGHLIGIVAQGETAAESRALLTQGNSLLQAAAYTTTTVALCPLDQQEELAEEGWIFWSETASLIPTEGNTADRYGAAIIRSLSREDGTAYLTLDDSQDMADALLDFIDQLAERSFLLEIPIETRL